MNGRHEKSKADLDREFEKARDNAAKRSGGRGFTLKGKRNAAGDVLEYMYVGEQLITREAHLPALKQALTDLGVQHEDVACPLEGLRVVGLRGASADDVLGSLDPKLATNVQLNHVVDTQVFPRLCPATEPSPAAGPTWIQSPLPAGAQAPPVTVIDTGVVQAVVNNTAWLTGGEVAGPPDTPADEGPYGCHGTFVAGVLRGVCRPVQVWVSDVVSGGVVSEIELVADMRTAIENGARLLSVSAGMYTRGGVEPVTLSWFRQNVLAARADTLILCAAGNDKTTDRFYPAASDWATGVGALTFNGGTAAAYSNTGVNVDVWAPGDGHVNAFINGKYTQVGGAKVDFQGLARWSGTSFATPLVAGLVARKVASTQPRPTPPQALAALTGAAPPGPGGKPKLIP